MTPNFARPGIAGAAIAYAVAAAALHAGTASAQTAAADNTGLNEIVVTAQRRAENIQDVPIAISAIDADALEQAGVTSVFDLRTVVPTLNIAAANGLISASLRGITTLGVASGFESPIAIYIDGVYQGSGGAAFLNFNDIAQVEVARGPQGTLFGRNATAGSIQINTRTPGQEFSAKGELSYGNYQTITAKGYMSGGIAPSVAADIAVQGIFQGKGWGRNLTLGGDNYITHHNVAVRSKWVIDATDTTRITLIGDYADFFETRSASILPGVVLLPRRPGFDRAPDLGYDTLANVIHDIKAWSAGGSLKLEQQIGDLTLMSLTAYRKSDFWQIFDQDQWSASNGSVDYAQLDTQFSQDLQLSSARDAPLSWVAGLSYYAATTSLDPQIALFLATNTRNVVRNHQDTDALAGYVQGSYEIAEGTRITLGGRYTSERRRTYDGSTANFTISTGAALPVVLAPDQQHTFRKFTFKASIDQKIGPDALVYASFNRGFKSGGYNTALPGVSFFLPENVDAYEVGLKTELFDRRVRFNAAAYYDAYENIQTRQNPNGVQVNITNAAAANIYGAEAEIEALLAKGLRLTGAVGYQSSKYSSFPNALFGNYNGLPNVFRSAKGNYLPLVSKFTSNLNLDYTTTGPGGGELRFAGNLYYNDGYFLGTDNLTRQDAFVQLGGQVKWTSADEHFSLALYGKNLTNRRTIIFAPASNSVEYTPPRTYGVTAGFSF